MYFNKKIIYIVENANWVIRWEGEYITRYLNERYNIRSGIFDIVNIKSLSKFKKKILHFGSRSTFLPDNHRLVDTSNKMVLTWFHGTDEDREYIKSLPEGSKKASIIHTACTLSKRDLIKWGAEEEKIVVIPLGVDLLIFKPANKDEKERIREEIGIPSEAVCIGSFQKDGEGWGEGNEPKLIKGPDIFCDVIEKIKKKHRLFILLTGPARGYVKNRLDEMNVPYKHFYLDNYSDIPKYYKSLDYYIVSSRIEGGPKSVLECFATGIPFVTTRVGMVDDIVEDGVNSLISDVEDITGLTDNLNTIIENKDLRESLIINGLKTAENHSWPLIAARLYKEIYSKLL